MRFAERTVDFPALDIAGRHVVDTYFQVMSFDVYKRDCARLYPEDGGTLLRICHPGADLYRRPGHCPCLADATGASH